MTVGVLIVEDEFLVRMDAVHSIEGAGFTLEIALEERAHGLGMILDDVQCPVLDPVAQRNHAAHPYPLFFEAAILSRIRSPVTSRSNWAKDNRTLRVRRPIELVVLNCCVTETNDTCCVSKSSTSRAKSASDRVSRSTL